MHTTMAIRIRRARLKASLTQGALADVMGVNRSAVAQWEKVEGGTSPSVGHLAKFATITRVSFEWLATGRGDSGITQEESTESLLDEIETQCLEAVRRLPKRRREAICRLLMQLTT